MQIVAKAIRKIKLLGVSRSVAVIKHRASSMYNYYTLKARYERGNTHHTWQEICTAMGQTFAIDAHIKNARNSHSYLTTLYDSQLDTHDICVAADAAVAKWVRIFDYTTPGIFLWHTDGSVSTQPYGGKADGFCLDYSVQSESSSQRAQDIKLPWELSRLMHFYVLGKAYQKTGNRAYCDAFTTQMHDWWDHNPYLTGINWMCAMEVALRAINMIAAWHFFVHDARITNDFWERYITSLYDHFHYLEHTFEWYDSRTNNHYLADLVGYAHLAHFFAAFKKSAYKRSWALSELQRELCKQIDTDGFSYEGSTAYHKLVTELAYHGMMCAHASNEHSASHLNTIVTRMLKAYEMCLDHAGNLACIGDNDSGTVLAYGLARSLFDPSCTHNAVMHAPDFGLSIIKNDAIHFTMRHHSYHPLQPSGHFHADAGSITLSVDGIPVFIDPGTYVYTASSLWRNQLRSMAVHNTYMLEECEPYTYTNLFAMLLPTGREGSLQYEQEGGISICTAHNWYASVGLRAHRRVTYERDRKTFELQDWWTSSIHHMQLPQTIWRFTLAPDIIPVNRTEFCVELYYHERLLVSMQSEHATIVKPCVVSLAYLQKKPSRALIMRATTLINHPSIFKISYAQTL